MIPQEKELLLNYLSSARQPFQYRGTERYSTLIAGLRDCRQLLSRNLDTGLRLQGEQLAVWLAAIGYFSILDQIGSAFKKVGTNRCPDNGSTIVYAIENFADLSAFSVVPADEQRVTSALKALRNSFTHDFNLLNTPRNPRLNALERHKFTVFSDSTESRLVILPVWDWNGDIDGKDFNATDDSTLINLFQFAELVESVFSIIVDGITNDSIETSESVHTTLNKYTFVTSSHPLRG